MMRDYTRRDIFRHVFGSSDFELDRDTANEVLMRIRRSLDPIPLTDEMWVSYRAIRRELQGSTSSPVDPAASARFRNLPEHLIKDFAALLRIETILRNSERVPDLIVIELTAEIRAEIGRLDDSEPYEREVLDPLIQYLLKAAGIALPHAPSV